MERGVVSIPAPGATSLSGKLSMKISNASTVRGKGIRGNKARGRFSAEHVYGRLREVAGVFSVL